MSMYSFIGFMAIIIFATILACGYAILKRIDEIDNKWKPSEYTLSLVKKVADGEMLTGVEQMAIGTLYYEQLKKL